MKVVLNLTVVYEKGIVLVYHHSDRLVNEGLSLSKVPKLTIDRQLFLGPL